MKIYVINFTRVSCEDKKRPFVKIGIEQNAGLGMTYGEVYYNLSRKINTSRDEEGVLTKLIEANNFPKSGKLELTIEK